MDEMMLKNKLTKEQHFEDFFIEKGVTKADIEASKSDIISGFGDFRLFCDKESTKKDVLIPVKQVKHPTRQGNIGVSWYNIVNYAFNGVPKDVDVNMAADRIWRLIVRNFVNEFESFEKWNDLFSTKESKMANFNFDMYDLGLDNDPIYFQAGGNGGGTHRMVLAKVTGVKNIFAKEVTIYKLNPQKKRLYDEIKEQEHNILNFIEKSRFFNLRDLDRNIELCMPNTNNHPLHLSQAIHNLEKNDYNDLDYVEDYLSTLKEIYLLLQEIERELNRNINIYKLLPTKILHYICEHTSIIFLEDIINNEISQTQKRQELVKSIKYHLAYDNKHIM